jgi:hypothetical protein
MKSPWSFNKPWDTPRLGSMAKLDGMRKLNNLTTNSRAISFTIWIAMHCCANKPQIGLETTVPSRKDKNHPSK